MRGKVGQKHRGLCGLIQISIDKIKQHRFTRVVGSCAP